MSKFNYLNGKMKIWKLKLLTLIFLFSLFFVSDTHAQESVTASYQVESFDSVVKVEKDASLNIEETVSVKFSGVVDEFRRPVPTKYFWNDEEISTIIDLVSVKNASGKDLKYKTSSKDDYLTIVIKSKDEKFGSEYSFKFNYRTAPLIEADNLQNEFFFDVLGTQWSVPVKTVEVSVISPYADIVDYNCIAGTPGTPQKFCVGEFDPENARFDSTNNLGQGKNFVIFLGIDKNGNVEPVEGLEKNKLWLLLNWKYVIVGLGVVLILVLLIKRLMRGKKILIRIKKK
ncbi:DUF2207 domain-containing protein [Candidatus Woesebacteria bacterium]|nr:DUF2207 domain-containing protein [Candidatus Woesebacteria bacterium]